MSLPTDTSREPDSTETVPDLAPIAAAADSVPADPVPKPDQTGDAAPRIPPQLSLPPPARRPDAAGGMATAGPPLVAGVETIQPALRTPTTPMPPLSPDPGDGVSPELPPPSTRRGLVYLAICLAFAVALTLPNLLGNLLPASSAPSGTRVATATPGPPPPCSHGATIAIGALAPGAPGTLPQLLAVVRPPAVPDNAPGTDPGCYTLYSSGDAGITWTVSFSATAESPTDVAVAPTGQTYALTQRLHFPYYLVANLYYSPARGNAWTWSRISPQERHAVPMVSASEMLVTGDGSVILREANGDGAALVRSRDEGATWQPLLIPRLTSVGSVAVLGTSIAVTSAASSAGQSPGMVSRDSGATWQPLGSLPAPPAHTGLHAVLSASDAEGALVLDLVPDTIAGTGGAVARYASPDGGRHWTPVRCGIVPAAGCAPVARWASVGGERFVLYHRRLWRQGGQLAAGSSPLTSGAGESAGSSPAAPLGDGKPCAPSGVDGCAAQGHGAWVAMPVSLPVLSADVIQVLAAAGPRGAVPYLVTARGIWRLDGTRWRNASSGLPLGFPNPWIG